MNFLSLQMQQRKAKDIYSSEFVEDLFDRMSDSYERVNYITSFGFSELWRRQCVKELDLKSGSVVVDLMTGMGECWQPILKKANKNSKLIGLDFSTQMINFAKKRKQKYPHANIELLKENVFDNSISSESVDYIISGFGMKTFNEQQLHLLAREIFRILKPEGRFSLIDVSVPKNKVLQSLYMFYLKNVIPMLGKLFLGDPETYKMLGIYTEAFGNAKQVEQIFGQYDFQVEYMEYFFGCASGVKGIKN